MRPDPGVAEPAHGPDEAHDERVGGALVEVVRRPGLLDAAGVDDRHLLGDLERLLLVVRHEDRRDVDLVVQPPQPVAQLLAHRRVQRAERLVEQEHARLHGERARERHALALAAGELRRVAIGPAAEVDEREQLVDALADLGLRALADLQAERDVVAHGHVLEGRVVLEDEADAAVLGGHRRHGLAGEQHLAAVGGLEPGEHPQERRLAAPGRAEEGGQRSVGNAQRDVVEGEEAVEALADVADVDGHGGFSLPCGGRAGSWLRSRASASSASTTEAA